MAGKFKKGDNVVVITGLYKGVSGNILRVIYKRCKKQNRVVTKILLDGVNMRVVSKKRVRNPADVGLKVPHFIDVSNVMHLDPKLLLPVRVGFKFVGAKKVRYSKKSGEIIDF